MISKHKVMRILYESCGLRDAEKKIAELRPINITEKTGHWTRQSQTHEFRNYYKCSICGEGDTYRTFNFCPHCGAKMVESIEKER